MRIVNLASGSKANSTFVHYGQTKMLIDVGLPEKQLKERLESIGESLNGIYAVLITHEHVDHIRSLKNLAKKTNIDFYIKAELVDSGLLDDIVFKESKLHKIENIKFNVGDFEVLPVEVSHDAVAPIGFVVNVFQSKSKVAFLHYSSTSTLIFIFIDTLFL